MIRFFANGAACALLVLFPVTGAHAADGSLIGEWSVEQLDGAPLVNGSTVTMRFDAEGRVTGKAGCNRYGASFTFEGNRVALSSAMSTRMACPPALMRQEARFLEIFAGEAHWAIDRGGLTITAGNGAIVRAKRLAGD